LPALPGPDNDKHALVICVGSACYARGNARTVPAVQEFLREQGLQDEVRVTATLCQNQCRQGPNLCFDGECLCGINPESVTEMLETRLKVAGS